MQDKLCQHATYLPVCSHVTSMLTCNIINVYMRDVSCDLNYVACEHNYRAC